MAYSQFTDVPGHDQPSPVGDLCVTALMTAMTGIQVGVVGAR